jgi:hypothetical protein
MGFFAVCGASELPGAGAPGLDFETWEPCDGLPSFAEPLAQIQGSRTAYCCGVLCVWLGLCVAGV